MESNEKLSLMAAIIRYAIDKGYEIQMTDRDQKATIKEVTHGTSQSFADTGFHVLLYPFIVDDMEDEDSVMT